MKKDIVLIGAGRLATQLALALQDGRSYRVSAVFSRTMASAEALAMKVGASATDRLSALPRHAWAYIIAVKDDALPLIATQLAELLTTGKETYVFHTAGSVPLSVLGPLLRHGVIYPMQTFSKERRLDFSRIPVFIEGNDEETLGVARSIASSMSSRVVALDSDRRRYLHLAAVFACNFANHCYTLAADILEKNGLPFDVMAPLIEETAAKAAVMHPRQAQTGPAVRYDRSVLDRQSQMLDDEPLTQQIYRLMSESIHQHQTPNT